MTALATHRVELPTGYTVVDHLGAGGYGEVWKATAPGGLEKAVKVVFGHCDEGMAERELKSLERIKSVRHPFLLSIERYEIVNNRLVIVTELADMSLSDCFQKHVAEGRTGIPREQLIAYLWDAADALDCLLEHHSLQHLDIKPENLLVVGDHIKVADFGLVKELASKTLNSVMGGMTPLYSAPEIYDNNPSPWSDQYSLAIVYQHMLTATLPFSGRTPAQLAKQHTLSQPNVSPLSETDRDIVRKALEKSPGARFPNCREFVSALRSAGNGKSAYSTRQHSSSTVAHKPTASDDTKSISMLDTKHLEDPVCAAATRVLDRIGRGIDDIAHSGPTSDLAVGFPTVDGQIVDVESPAFDHAMPASSAPTLVVGIGGVGIKMLKAVRSREHVHSRHGDLPLAWLAIDVDRESLIANDCTAQQHDLSADDKLHIPLRRPNQYREDSQALLKWVSRRWLYNIPRSLQTRGFRPLGRIAMVDHAGKVLAGLEKRLHRLAVNPEGSDGSVAPIRVVVLAGMSGGTGGGTIIDVAQSVRSICQEHAQPVEIHAVLGCTYHPESNDSLAAANMFSLLTEMSHAQRYGNIGDCAPPGPAARYESSQPPFDEVYIVPMERGRRTENPGAIQSIADYLLLNSGGVARGPIEAIRSATSLESACGLLRTFSCADLGQLKRQIATRHQQELLAGLIAYWLEEQAAINDPDERFFQSHAHSRFVNEILKYFPEAAAACGASPGDVDRAEQRSDRSSKIKYLADGFLQFVESVVSQQSIGQSSLAHPGMAIASKNIIARLSQLVTAERVAPNELSEQMLEIVNEQLTAMAAINSGPEKVAEAALSVFAASPLDCGYQRRTVLIAQHDENDAEQRKALLDCCPTLAICPAQQQKLFLIREGSGLDPLHLGAQLYELYPDIVDAAGRLHSRDDIKWQDLRTTRSESSPGCVG